MKQRRCLIVVFLAAILSVALPFTARASDSAEAEKVIVAALEAEQKQIELEDFRLKTDELLAMMDQMRLRNRWPWYMDTYSYSYNDRTGIVSSMTVEYLDPAAYDREFYDRELARIFSRAVFPGMSQQQIALSLHDYLSAHYAYDESLTHRDVYDLLYTGEGVCAGYAGLYQDLLALAGVESVLCSSEDMDHMWNMVKIDGNWYHIDVTWDDPISDCRGRVAHSYFMLDDSTVQDEAHGHYNWEPVETANRSVAPEDAFWLDLNSAVCYESAAVSYILVKDGTNYTVYRRDENTGNLTTLDSIDAGYVDVGAGRYHYQNYGLSFWNGWLYYSDMEHVYAIRPDGTGRSVVYEHDANNSGAYIAGSMVDNGLINLTLSTHDGQYSLIQVPLAADAPVHEHDYQTIEVAPSCDADGYVRYECPCGDGFAGKTLAMTGHAYDSGTALDGGMIRYRCTVCGAVREEMGNLPMPTEKAPVHNPKHGGLSVPLDWRIFFLIGLIVFAIIQSHREERRYRF